MDSKEYITVSLESYKWNSIRDHCNLDASDFTIKEVKIVDDLFKDDATHKELRKAATKAYKSLNEYEFKKRNK